MWTCQLEVSFFCNTFSLVLRTLNEKTTWYGTFIFSICRPRAFIMSFRNIQLDPLAPYLESGRNIHLYFRQSHKRCKVKKILVLTLILKTNGIVQAKLLATGWSQAVLSCCWLLLLLLLSSSYSIDFCRNLDTVLQCDKPCIHIVDKELCSASQIL